MRVCVILYKNKSVYQILNCKTYARILPSPLGMNTDFSRNKIMPLYVSDEVQRVQRVQQVLCEFPREQLFGKKRS